MEVMTARLIQFKKRLPRFRRLRRVGISTVRLLKTGGKAGMTNAQGIMGGREYDAAESEAGGGGGGSTCEWVRGTKP